MILLIAAAALAQQTPITGGEVFSKMLKHYFEASSIKGTITFTQSTKGVGVQVLTSVQREAPNHFYLEQTRSPRSNDPEQSNSFLGVCDGKRMSYTVPKGFLPWTDASSGKHSRMYEPAPKGYEDGLNAFCTMLVDRSLPVAVAMYNAYEIERVTNRLSNLKVVSEETEFAGKVAYKIEAAYTFAYAKPATGQPAVKIPATVIIDKAFNLLYLEWEEPLGTPQREVIPVKSEWTINLQVNPSTLDKALFTVR